MTKDTQNQNSSESGPDEQAYAWNRQAQHSGQLIPEIVHAIWVNHGYDVQVPKPMKY